MSDNQELRYFLFFTPSYNTWKSWGESNSTLKLQKNPKQNNQKNLQTTLHQKKTPNPKLKKKPKKPKPPHLQSMYKEVILILSNWSHWDRSPKKSDKGILVSS